jgi:hypothetical protein
MGGRSCQIATGSIADCQGGGFLAQAALALQLFRLADILPVDDLADLLARLILKRIDARFKRDCSKAEASRMGQLETIAQNGFDPGGIPVKAMNRSAQHLLNIQPEDLLDDSPVLLEAFCCLVVHVDQIQLHVGDEEIGLNAVKYRIPARLFDKAGLAVRVASVLHRSSPC